MAYRVQETCIDTVQKSSDCALKKVSSLKKRSKIMVSFFAVVELTPPLGLHAIISVQHYENAEQYWILYAIIFGRVLPEKL